MECEDEFNFQIVDVVSLNPDAINMASSSTKVEEKPTESDDSLLLKLIKSLVIVKDKENEQMVLTNLQIMEILRKEFKIKLKKKTELEVDIYMNILKHFLQIWPQWVELESIAESDNVDIDRVLYEKCKELKKYLAEALEMAEREMGPMVKKHNEEEAIAKRQEEANAKQVVMEIVCSRSQLNSLIFNQPHPKMNNTIFNIEENARPVKISLQNITLKHIINWPHIRLSILLPGFECTRWNSSHIERAIVNMKSKQNKKRSEVKHPLNMKRIFHRRGYSRMQEPRKEYVLNYLDQLSAYIIENKVMSPTELEMFFLVLQQFRMDFENVDMHFKFGEYRFYMNNYKYVRYLCTEVPECEQTEEYADKFDLRLEEILTPCHTFNITKVKMVLSAFSVAEGIVRFTFDDDTITHFRNTWLKVYCALCGMSFDLTFDCSKLESHFMECHQTNLEWSCSNCQKSFTVLYLTENRWYHKCEKSNKKSVDAGGVVENVGSQSLS